MDSVRRLRCDSVGLGWRSEIAREILTEPREIDVIEIVAERCFARSDRWREAEALADRWPIVPHGIRLSLGSADGIAVERAERLGRLARAVRAPMITEHVAFTRSGSREIGHLTQLPMTRAAVRVVTRNVAHARRYLPDVPLVLENAAWMIRWPDDEMREGDFYAEICAATGCSLLLDVANVYANARNSRSDPFALLASYPLDRVAQIHLAGGIERDGFYFDTHAAGVPAEVLRMLDAALARSGPVPIVIERDAAFPPFVELLAELRFARDAQTRAAAIVSQESAPRPVAKAYDALDPALAAKQRRLAIALTDTSTPERDVIAAYGAAPVMHARDVLRRKRVDEALALLPHVARIHAPLPESALAAMMTKPPAMNDSPIADAMRLAHALRTDVQFGAAARRDGLALRARFVSHNHRRDVRPRLAPFVSFERLRDGTSVWAIKTLGRDARVRVIER